MANPMDVLVTGGAGYVGAVLVPKLLSAGHRVTVLDLYLYGDDVLSQSAGNPGLTEVKGDIRDRGLVRKHMAGQNAVIHLACISNDPSYELDPGLGKSINYDAFKLLVEESKAAGVGRFIYASSSSVYGIKDEAEVTEDLAREPLTDYSKYKALCEDVLLAAATDDFVCTVIRPSTVCGYSPRLRLDLTVNILTNHAVHKGEITVFGGEQKRPNIHIQDMADLYVRLLELPAGAVANKVWNAGFENYKVGEIAQMVRGVINPDLPVKTVPSDDIRSYHVSSKKISDDIGFVARHTIEDAVRDLADAFAQGLVPDPMTDPRYYNIKLMQSVNLK
ncbi:MAG: NAD-dependent epimerase/dehydratase family protein [Proteobacteria bacterium]|nr:NAD-dependent epimerase/dehydratase family protein [Pseudomonadota bacterium]